MDKIEAARAGQGLIKLEADSAEQVKQAIEQVSKIISCEDNLVSFEGHRIVAGHGFALRVNCFDIYECPNGYLLHTYLDQGSNWAVAGKTLEEMLAKAPDQAVARRAHGELVKQNLASIHQY
jgi:N-acetylmuramic acid 6-phosphate (MurNAc-6-P) etherase